MSPSRGRPGPALCAGALCLFGAVGVVLTLVPISLELVLGLWVVGSVPVGMTVGHCALNQDD